METGTATIGRHEDVEYGAFLVRMQEGLGSVLDANPVLFRTNASGLWELYLTNIPPEDRQHYTCSACRHFVERYGDLASMDPNGAVRSIFWDPAAALPGQEDAIRSMSALVSRAWVKGVFLSAKSILGFPEKGGWSHLSVQLPEKVLYQGKVKDAGQAEAEKRHDFSTLQVALKEFGPELVAKAVNLLRAEVLYRSEKVLGAAEWLFVVHEKLRDVKDHRLRNNVLWGEVARAPAGFCHPRSTMIGTLLEDLEAGLPFDVVAERFRAKMSPLLYQRPQAAPSAGNIEEAEKVVAKLGVERSLLRRYARVEELKTIWTPAEQSESKEGGVFSGIVPKGAKGTRPFVCDSVQIITWTKFERTILPEAREIEVYLPARSSAFAAFLTAEDPEAPPILQWDRAGARNPFSMYTWVRGSLPTQWGLRADEFVRIVAISRMPWQWEDPSAFPHQHRGVLLVLEGAREFGHPGLCLFPEILASKFHSIRATIEAFNCSREPSGREAGSACGLFLSPNHDLNVKLSVRSDALAMRYEIDRWD